MSAPSFHSSEDEDDPMEESLFKKATKFGLDIGIRSAHETERRKVWTQTFNEAWTVYGSSNYEPSTRASAAIKIADQVTAAFDKTFK